MTTLQLTDRQPDSSVQEAEYARLLGYPPRHVPEGRALELAQWAREWYSKNGRPWIYARQSLNLELAGERVRIDHASFSSKQLRDQFDAAKAHTSVVVAVSAGPECEQKARELWEEGKPDEYFFMEMYGAAVVEHLITAAGGRICDWAEKSGMAALPHFSPGYSGWDVSDQVRLWQLIRGGADANFAANLEVMDTGMLRPKKSLLALIGITRHLDLVLGSRNLVPCENCALPRCQYRRKPYRNFLPQVEDVRRLQAGEPEEQNASRAPRLNHNARYTVNARALQKWSVERLRLKVLHDRSVEASFRYEGTTCSNLGIPLEFDYHIKLSPPEDGHRIIDAVCAPAPGDIGHTSQCEYLANAEPFMRAIADDRPLLGRPLNEVFTWERPYDPSGCFCDAARRAHKWGLVFEVTHYALAEREKELYHKKS
ncbi:MAG TPA: hypothetical protein VN048_15740 [Verrucomicrobiae bacterium]|jgi:hypothetical protein|nr:hypothetical protein [Verrucomicrobiae bacterium]